MGLSPQHGCWALGFPGTVSDMYAHSLCSLLPAAHHYHFSFLVLSGVVCVCSQPVLIAGSMCRRQPEVDSLQQRTLELELSAVQAASANRQLQEQLRQLESQSAQQQAKAKVGASQAHTSSVIQPAENPGVTQLWLCSSHSQTEQT